jgi:hypothetical protein
MGTTTKATVRSGCVGGAGRQAVIHGRAYLTGYFKVYGLIPDRFFGSWGRTVWNNCVNDLKDILEPED